MSKPKTDKQREARGTFRASRPALSRPNDPLIGDDGRTHLPIPYMRDTEGNEIKSGPLPTQDRADKQSQTNVEFKDFRAQKRRSMSELPAPISTLKPVAVIFTLTLLGLSDREIANSLDIGVEQVLEIRGHSAYTECFESIFSELVNANSELIHARLAAYSHDALTQIGHMALTSKAEPTRLRAAQDLLDRAGHRPQESGNRAGAMKAGLRIIMVQNAQQTEVQVFEDGE